MRLSQSLSKTIREAPAEAETASHQLMLRAGLIYQVAAGLYAYLPLAYRSLRKIEEIIREEMNLVGGQEVHMPALQPLDLWKKTGRDKALGETLFKVKDRRERDLVLAPTHEEVVTSLVKSNVNSYRDLPLIVYQLQTKFRDEPRPRAGLLRVREFLMKDAYSFDVDESGLSISYDKMLQAYKNIFERTGLPTLVVEADSGAIGGKDSQEFVLHAEAGEDTVLNCENCGYAANLERARFGLDPLPVEQEKPLSEIATPGATTIVEVANAVGVEESRTLKSVFYISEGKLVFVVIRGDLEINEIKLGNALKMPDLRMASDQEVRDADIVPGYASPVGRDGLFVVADESINSGVNFVVGANKDGYHLLNANTPRDFKADVVADIALAKEGYKCPNCDSTLDAKKGIEVGHIFKLGSFYADRLSATYLDEHGKEHSMIMGCYGIGVGRLLAAAVEQNHDDKGIVFPNPIAPYQIHLISLNSDNESVSGLSDSLYDTLQANGFEVLYDDREESAGIKFNDADLLGMPVRLVVSQRNLKEQAVEVKLRSEDSGRLVPIEDIVGAVGAILKKG